MQLFSLISALLLRVALLQSGDVALDGFALLLELFHRALQAPTADTRRTAQGREYGMWERRQQQQPLGKHARRGLRMERARQEKIMLGAMCGSHMSFLMNSTRLVTLFFTSTNSCLTSTGPINLKTDESSSRSSSSCDEASAANV